MAVIHGFFHLEKFDRFDDLEHTGHDFSTINLSKNIRPVLYSVLDCAETRTSNEPICVIVTVVDGI